MGERVSVIHGKNPVIFVAPHGFDDTHTDVMTEAAANACGGNAVINRGWERDTDVDVLRDKANCNKIAHATSWVVKDEFYDPIWKMYHRMVAKGHKKIYVFHIHGCGNNVLKKESVYCVIGWGDGEAGKRRPTATSAYKDYFASVLDGNGVRCGVAGAGSNFAAWDHQNLLQMWRGCGGVEALQLEYVTAARSSKASAATNGTSLGVWVAGIVSLQQAAARKAPPGFTPRVIT